MTDVARQSRHVSSPFPITLWPSTPLPPVLVQPTADSIAHPQQLPDQWVLRDLDAADLDSDAVVGALLEDYGTISQPFFDRLYVPPGRRELLATPPSEYELDREWWWERRSDGTLEDARWWLKTARAIVRMWRIASFDREPVGNAWHLEGFVSIDALPTEMLAWMRFTDALTAGLRPFQPRVVYGEQSSGPQRRFLYGVQPHVGLYSAACHQFFNFIVTGATPRLCENATCGRVFVHQIGGSAGHWHRSKGLRFCTPKCARAETQRQYRRRKKEQKP